MNRTWTGAAFILCAALLGGASTLFPVEDGAEGLTAPVLALGGWLRQKSLSGAGGNLLAWALTALIAALPLLLLLLPRGRGSLRWEDGLLPLASALLLALIYGAVNPTLVGSRFSEGWLMAALGASVGTALAAWLILRVLRGAEGGSLRQLSRVLEVLLTACAALLVFAAAARGSGNLLNLWDQGEADAARRWAEQELGFQGAFPDQMADRIFLSVVAAVDGVPSLLGAWVLVLAARLSAVLAREPFGAESAGACELTARRSRQALSAALLLALGRNLCSWPCSPGCPPCTSP